MESIEEKVTQLETTVKDLQKALTEERQKSAKLQTELDGALEVNQELSASLGENTLQPVAPQPSATESVSDKTFKLAAKDFKKESEDKAGTYGFSMIRVNHNGKIITAAEVLASKDLQSELAAMDSGMIYKK